MGSIQFFKDLIFRQRTRYFWHVFFLSALLLTLSGSGAWYVRVLYSELAGLFAENVVSIRAAKELDVTLRKMQTALRMSGPIFKGFPEAEGILATFTQDMDRLLGAMNSFASTIKEKILIEQIQQDRLELMELLGLAGAASDAATDIKKEIRVRIDQLVNERLLVSIDEYIALNHHAMFSVVDKHRLLSDRFAIALFLIGLFSSTGGFLLGFKASRRLKNFLIEVNLPLSVAADKLNQVVGPIRLATSLDLWELKNILETIAVEADRVVTRLQASQTAALHAEKLAAVGQLAAGTAHEIRNPLMAIKLLVQANRLEPCQPLSEQDLAVIEKEINRVEKTLHNLLAFTRAPQLSRGLFAPTCLVDQCVQLISGRAIIQGVKIAVDLDPDLGLLEGDQDQLHQVLLNILFNALDATPRYGLIKISVKKELCASNGSGYLRFAVTDSGLGIAEDIVPRIFEPFRSSKETGTGLGLSLAKQIVEAHGGEIFARNELSGGATLEFTVPAVGNSAI